MVKSLAWLAIGAVLVAFAMPAGAQAPVLVDEQFNGATDPLTQLYQDPATPQPSYFWSDPNDNMSGQARNGRAVTPTTLPSTAERAYVTFDPTGYGDGDQYLEYTECFNFSFDLNFSSFAPAANDERLLAGLWYSPADASADNSTHYIDWANRQHFVGVAIGTDGSTVKFMMTFSNNGDWAGKASSDDLTGAASLSTGVNYRVVGHYRWDGTTYGQLYGELWDLDTNTLVGSIAQQVVTQDTPDIYSVSYINFTGDTVNRQFLKLSTMGVGNETIAATRLNGPEFTSDNWLLYGCNPLPVPEPGTLVLFGSGLLCLLALRKRK
jgi:hypothetical protein